MFGSSTDNGTSSFNVAFVLIRTAATVGILVAANGCGPSTSTASPISAMKGDSSASDWSKSKSGDACLLAGGRCVNEEFRDCLTPGDQDCGSGSYCCLTLVIDRCPPSAHVPHGFTALRGTGRRGDLEPYGRVCAVSRLASARRLT
jgi:hypothetical protein